VISEGIDRQRSHNRYPTSIPAQEQNTLQCLSALNRATGNILITRCPPTTLLIKAKFSSTVISRDAQEP
jgi:hypothetical protein